MRVKKNHLQHFSIYGSNLLIFFGFSFAEEQERIKKNEIIINREKIINIAQTEAS